MVHADQAMVDQLCSIRCLLEAAEDRVIDVFFVTLPEAGGTRTFSTGTTKIDYAAGTIINPDGSVEQITRKLDDVQNKSVMHSISIYAEDAAVIFALDGSGKQTVQQQFLFQLPYVTFTKIQITCTENTEVNLFACTNPQATLGNFRLTQITDITQPYIVADDPEATTWDTNLISLRNNMNRIRNQIISITGESWGTVSNSIASILNTSTGHDHDGTDSKKVSAGSVNNTPAGNVISTDVQAAITELDGQDTTHAADTSTHGVNEVADVATVSAEIDSDITTHAAIKSANAVIGHVIVETTSDIDVDASGKLTLGNHAGNHTDGTDDIQNATSGQKGLATAAQITKLDGIDTGAKDDQTGAEIKAAYEGEADTNAYDNAAVSKLGGIEASSDVTDATNIASSIVGTVAKATPVDADTVPLIDSADSSSLKEVLWSQIKATLKSYFDTLYDVAGGLSTHEADTSTHGVNEVADVATVSAEIDSDITIHAAIKSANAVIGHVIVETTSDIDVDASGKLTLGNHAGNHTDGTDDIQNATSGQKGLATAAQITKLDGIDTGAKDDQTGAEIISLINSDENVIDDDNIAASIARDSEVSAAIAICPLMEYLISDNLLHSHDAAADSGTPAQSPTLLKTITLDRLYPSPSTLRIKFTINRYTGGAGWSKGRIYKNGSPFGTEQIIPNGVLEEFSEDLSFSDGDDIELYGWNQYDSVGVRATNLRIYGDEVAADPFQVTNS